MSKDFSEIKAFSTTPFEAFAAATASSTKGLHAIAAEIIDYSTKSFEKSRVLFERLNNVKKIEEAMQLQSDFVKSVYEDYITQATKIGEIYASLAKEAFKPINVAPAAQPSAAAPPLATISPSGAASTPKSKVAGSQNGFNAS
ncbi:phasin family protein [Methylocystis echinoides]|uniref:phasin family protein n=1 Tax=Methylocystis echinoides TaxID=29468 RepID=UPI00342E400D